jgi:hypothetical protein
VVTLDMRTIDLVVKARDMGDVGAPACRAARRRIEPVQLCIGGTMSVVFPVSFQRAI